MIEFALMLLIQQNFVDFAHGILPENFTGFVQQRDLVKMAVFDAVLAVIISLPSLSSLSAFRRAVFRRPIACRGKMKHCYHMMADTADTEEVG